MSIDRIISWNRYDVYTHIYIHAYCKYLCYDGHFSLQFKLVAELMSRTLIFLGKGEQLYETSLADMDEIGLLLTNFRMEVSRMTNRSTLEYSKEHYSNNVYIERGYPKNRCVSGLFFLVK